jgi:proton-dependent oligopeptide transporter, POT family
LNDIVLHRGERRASEWFGQPPGLTILFLTDMWEQFSYYGMRVLLVYYMVKQLRFSQQHASLVFGAYTAFVFLTPVVGGVICDRWLGRRTCVVLGGLIMALGHFTLASESLFYVALATIGVGNGLFLPSLPSQVSELYRRDDPRRANAYNYFYAGANLGAFLAPFAVGTVGEIYGWHWGFALAGVGMMVGLAIYLAGGRYLPSELPHPDQREPPLVASRLEKDNASGAISIRRRLLLLGGVGVAAIIFRIAYGQVGNTLPLWIEHVDRRIGSYVIPMTWIQALNPLFVFALTPWIVSRWLRLARRSREPSALRKMATGAGVLCVAYLMLAGVDIWGNLHHTASGWGWLIAFFAVMTAGELYILPIGLGLFGSLAPVGLEATSIALWFLAAFGGNLGAGVLGTLWSRLTHAEFLVVTAAVSALSGLILLSLDRPARQEISCL